MIFQKASESDFHVIQRFYWDVIDNIHRNNVKNENLGWEKGVYPSDDFIQEKGNMMLKLVKFGKEYMVQLNEMMDEWTAANEKIIPWSIRKCDYHDIDRYIESLEIKEPHGKYVPNSTFFCLDTKRNIFIGAVNIRHYLNDTLIFADGHIGDGIRPNERGKGLGTKMVALALDECRKLEIRDVLMCCDKSNIASARTIEKNGGILENEVLDDGVPVLRYWIKL